VWTDIIRWCFTHFGYEYGYSGNRVPVRKTSSRYCVSRSLIQSIDTPGNLLHHVVETGLEICRILVTNVPYPQVDRRRWVSEVIPS